MGQRLRRRSRETPAEPVSTAARSAATSRGRPRADVGDLRRDLAVERLAGREQGAEGSLVGGERPRRLAGGPGALPQRRRPARRARRRAAGAQAPPHVVAQHGAAAQSQHAGPLEGARRSRRRRPPPPGRGTPPRRAPRRWRRWGRPRATTRASVSTKGTPSAAASSRPTALLPAPMKPTSATAAGARVAATAGSALPDAPPVGLGRGDQVLHRRAAEAVQGGVRQRQRDDGLEDDADRRDRADVGALETRLDRPRAIPSPRCPAARAGWRWASSRRARRSSRRWRCRPRSLRSGCSRARTLGRVRGPGRRAPGFRAGRPRRSPGRTRRP